MSMSASTKIVNDTGSEIMFSSVSKVNDDQTWDVTPSVGTHIKNGDNCLIAMGNSSVPFAPKGVGFKADFVCQSNFQAGSIHLDDPAVGKHEFKFYNKEVFHFHTTNPSGNTYVVTVSLHSS